MIIIDCLDRFAELKDVVFVAVKVNAVAMRDALHIVA
jgi:hypothetical protein